MRTVVGIVLAAVVGIHCSAPAESTGSSAPELTGEEAPGAPPPGRTGQAAPDEPFAVDPKSPNHLQRSVVDVSAFLRDAARTDVTSVVVDPEGATYATGTFTSEVVIGETHITSRGDKDVFLLKVDASGAFAWVRAVGSAYAESEPRVKLEGTEVNVIGLTDGAMDCGAGPLATWSSATFFFCVFGATDGTSVSGGVFPTGTP